MFVLHILIFLEMDTRVLRQRNSQVCISITYVYLICSCNKMCLRCNLIVLVRSI